MLATAESGELLRHFSLKPCSSLAWSAPRREQVGRRRCQGWPLAGGSSAFLLDREQNSSDISIQHAHTGEVRSWPDRTQWTRLQAKALL